MLESYKWMDGWMGLEISVGTDSKSTALRFAVLINTSSCSTQLLPLHRIFSNSCLLLGSLGQGQGLGNQNQGSGNKTSGSKIVA